MPPTAPSAHGVVTDRTTLNKSGGHFSSFSLLNAID
jgi:hypothetical protein